MYYKLSVGGIFWLLLELDNFFFFSVGQAGYCSFEIK